MRELGESKKQMLNMENLVVESVFIENPLKILLNIHGKRTLCFHGTRFSYSMAQFLALGFDDHQARMLADAYAAVDKADLWDYLRLPSTPGKDGFMFSSAIELAMINAHMTYGGHSGASYAWTMRQMEAIAKEGWDVYANRIQMTRVMEQRRHEEEVAKIRAERACPCRAAAGHTSGWCGVAGGGVPACDH